jgi:hypothetical protein
MEELGITQERVEEAFVEGQGPHTAVEPMIIIRWFR